MKSARQLLKQSRKALSYVQDNLSPMLDDPMTHAMGAPVDDFVEKWKNKARHLQCDCLDDLRKANVCKRMQNRIIDELCAEI